MSIPSLLYVIPLVIGAILLYIRDWFLVRTAKREAATEALEYQKLVQDLKRSRAREQAFAQSLNSYGDAVSLDLLYKNNRLRPEGNSQLL